jgi:hypothetical protein
MLHVNRFEIRNNVVKKLCNYLKIPITLTVKNVISETETMMPLQWMSARHKRHVTFHIYYNKYNNNQQPVLSV